MQAGGELAVAPRRDAISDDAGHLEEQQWVRATLTGDHTAFDSLVERHWRKVASVVGRFLSDPNEVEDTVQETFVRAYQNLRRFRGEASVRTWLIRIAVNLCRSRHGEFWRRRVSLTDDPTTLVAEPNGPESLADAVLLRAEWDDALHAALRGLPEKLRVPIVLHFFEDLTGAEIAVVLGCNPSTVWSRIYVGCRHMRKSLSDYRET